MQSQIQISAQSLSTTAAAAMIDIPEDCILKSISWALDGLAGAGNARYSSELSFGSTAVPEVNDARQVIDVLSASFLNAATLAMNKVTPMDMQLFAGERLYVHNTINGTTLSTVNLRIVLSIEMKGARTTLRRR